MSGRRELDPIFTQRYVHVPNLREKLDWFFSHHPFIKTHRRLAQELHISPAALSTWLNGTRYTDTKTIAVANPDSIPTRHYRTFLDVLGLPAAILEIEDLGEFRNALATFEGGRSAWENLIRALPDDPAVEILVNAERGIVNPDDEEDEGVPTVFVNSEIMLRVSNPGLQHGILLAQDRNGWSCLRPTPSWMQTQVGTALVFPRQRDEKMERFARLDGTLGAHRMVAIFTADPLPTTVMDILLSRPMDVGGLNHSVSVFQNRLAAGPNACRMFSRRFSVAGQPAVYQKGQQEEPHSRL
jgi:hypothetical protein